jgi:hypothetical protein
MAFFLQIRIRLRFYRDMQAVFRINNNRIIDAYLIPRFKMRPRTFPFKGSTKKGTLADKGSALKETWKRAISLKSVHIALHYILRIPLIVVP